MRKIYLLKIYLSIIGLCLWSFGAAAQDYNVTTTAQCNAAAGGNETVSFTNATSNAIGNGTLTVYFNGDFDGGSAGSEYLDIYGETGTTALGNTTSVSSSQCGANYDSIVLTIPMADINSWASDGTIDFLSDAASGVSAGLCSGNSYCVYMKLEYPRATTANDIGIAGLNSPVSFCAGLQNVVVTVQNYGTNQVDTATVNWTWNGVLQTPINVYQLIDTAQGSNPNSLQVTLGSENITDKDTLVVWTSSPNNALDTVNVNDTLMAIVAPSLAGTFTLDAGQPVSNTNYQTFAAFANDLSVNGICGPVVLNVAPGSGPYNEQVTFSAMTGASATNTITINGNGDTLTSSGTTLNLDGADYVTINNLVINATGTSGFAVHLMNDADHNTFDSCSINADPTSTSSASAGVSMSGSTTSYSSQGSNGSFNTFSYCTITGGYWGFVAYGSAPTGNSNNDILHCTIQDFYYYGCYNYQQGDGTISDNIVERPNRSSVSSFYGIVLSTGCTNMTVANNRVRNAFGGNPGYSGTIYALYCTADGSTGNENLFYNNVVSEMNGNSTLYCMYMSGADYVQVYHNTLSLDYTAATTSSNTYGIYSTGTTGIDIENNIIFITRGGTGTKYGLYYSGGGKTSNYNDIYVNSAGGNNNIGYYSGAQATLAAWQAVNSSAWDQNSVSINPMFASPSTGDFTPGNSLMDNAGTPIAAVTTDITGAARNTTTPDMGAYEFSVPPCFGSPVAGTASAPDSVCSGESFNLTLTGFTIGSGISIQWQESPAGAGFWSDITGATTATYTVAAGITTPMDYQAIITCSNGGATNTSNAISVGINPFYACYCTSTAIYTGDEDILNVMVGSLNNSSTCATVAPGPGSVQNLYSNYTTLSPATVTQGTTVPFSIQIGTCGSNYNNWTKMYIDFNQNGDYTDPGEEVFSSASYTNGPHTETGTISIPLTATTGVTGLRVVNVETTSSSSVNPCGTYSYGETEDYYIDIAAAVPCNGVPSPGGAYGPATVCSGTSFILIDTASTPGLGITYQWEESPAGAGVWSAITGATNSSYTVASGITAATDYHLLVTCTNGGGSDVSNTVSVGMSPFYLCYCSPLTGTTLHTYGYNYLTDVSITNTSLSNTSTSVGAGGYTQYYPTTTTTTASLVQGVQYLLNATAQYTNYPISAWVDFDGSGTFDATEYVAMTPDASGYDYSGTFTMPLGGVSGNTGIRLRLGYNPGYTASESCYNYSSGYETEDYIVNVIVPAPCGGTPSAGTAYAPSSVCPGMAFTLNDTAYTVASGITFQWEESPSGAGAWSAISGATTPMYTYATGIVSATDFRLVATCANGGGMSTSNTITLTPTTYTAPYVQSFNTGGLPSCWSTSATGNTGWQYSQGSGPGYDVTGATEHTGNGGYFAWVDGSYVSGGASTSITSPAIDISSLTAPQVRYYVISYNPTYTATNGNNKLIVDAWNGTTWVTLDSIQQSLPAGWNERNISLSSLGPVATTQLRFTFTATASTSFYNDILIDDIHLENAPTCLAPTGLAATNITTTSADLAWTANGTATQWSIEYGPTGFTPGTGTFISTTTNPYTLSGLSAGSAYDVYVKSICSTTDSSFVNGPVAINTTQIPVSGYPYAINWDNGGGGWTYANGNQPNKWFVGAPGANNGTGGLYVSNDGGVTNGYNNNLTTYVHAYRDLDLTSFSAAIPLTFNSYVVGELPNWDYLSVWIVPMTYDPIPGSAVSGGTQIGTNINGESGWTQHLLNIPASYAGTMARLVLQWHNDASSGSAPVKVDNLTIGGFPLVIKLKDISATNLGAKNRVDWSTESELKSDKFELERSADGRNFTYLATIKAKGEASNYSYVDLSPVTGVNYYRLKMIDAAGAVATSKVVTATVKQGVFTVEAYPNPVTEKLTVQVYGGSDQNATVAITDVTGKVMKVVSVVNGKAEVNMSGLAAGVYLVKYTDNNHSQTIKVNKQ